MAPSLLGGLVRQALGHGGGEVTEPTSGVEDASDHVFAGMLRYGRPAPSYRQSDATSVVVELRCVAADIPFPKLVIDEEGRRKAPLPLDAMLALSCVRREGRVNATSLVVEVQKDASAARAVAARPVEAGLLTGHGTRSRTYMLSPAAYSAIGKKAASVRQAGFDPLQQAEMVRTWVRRRSWSFEANGVERDTRLGQSHERAISRYGPR